MSIRFAWLRRFLAAFCLSLLVVLTGMAFLIADMSTCQTLSTPSPVETASADVSIAALPDWAQDIYALLPAPMRLWIRIPEVMGIWVPMEEDRQEHLPRFG